jgi:PKD domain-containing protein
MNWTRALSVVLAVAVVVSGLGLFGAYRGSAGFRAGTGPSLMPAIAYATNPPISASLSISPNSVNQGQTITVSTTASGGNPSPSYTYQYNGLPNGCTGNNVQSFTCTPSQTGTFKVNATVSDNNGNTTYSNTVNLVVSATNGGGGNGGNNSSNPLSNLLSGFSGLLSLLFILGIVGFITWILLVVGVWIIAIVLLRRLPKRAALTAAMAGAATITCGSCSAAMPAGSKFCPQCGVTTAPKTT